jgi:putative glutamine amidotransferase
LTLVAITQRVVVDAATRERRDALDRRWHAFLAADGLGALPVPNDAAAALTLVEAVDPAGVILSGGGDLTTFGGDAADRDETEVALVRWAERRGKPVIGVCRGMQQIVQLGGGRIERIDGHVHERHRLRFRGRSVSVNSFHELAVTAVPEREFEVLARAPGGTIEAVRHRTVRRTGIMWHPEREPPFADHDLALFRQTFHPVAIQAACAD